MRIFNIFKPKWKHQEFDPQSAINAQNKKADIPVEEFSSALTEIELRDR